MLEKVKPKQAQTTRCHKESSKRNLFDTVFGRRKSVNDENCPVDGAKVHLKPNQLFQELDQIRLCIKKNALISSNH